VSKKTHQKELARARAKRQAVLGAKRRRTRVMAIVLVLAMAATLFVGALVARGGDEPDGYSASDTPTDAATTPPADPAEASYANPQPTDAEPCPPGSEGDAPAPDTTQRSEAPELTIDESAGYTATLETTCGTIALELDPAAAPTTVNNFVTLARDGYYEGVPFHRVINGFMIQGGDPTGTGSGGPGYTFADELELAQQLVADEGGYPRGSVAMANAGPNTNGSQFFIVQAVPGYPLQPAYTVFGEVADGMDVVDRIAQGPTEGDQAVDPVRIVSVDVSGP
jgi:cyclophilin family peptidyl-prolyl cis-trans isomerase